MKRKLYLTTSSLLLFAVAHTPLLAHNIKTSEDVGVTFHIEPDHNPRVGTSNQAWFALTRQGGKLIPLEECVCQLNVYLTNQGNRSDTPTLSPELVPISPEQYRNIPGANITFPQPGIYDLELVGKPAIAGDFAPFSVSYPVTVKPGLISEQNLVSEEAEQSPVKEDSVEPANLQAELSLQSESEPLSQPKASSVTPWLIGTIGGGLAVLLLLLRKPKSPS